ncbi:MAG: phosphatidylinositol kinase, partial [Kocuria rhizophila]
DGVGRVLEGLDGELGRELAELLGAEEVEALAERYARLLDDGIFPAPGGLTPAVPWPLF